MYLEMSFHLIALMHIGPFISYKNRKETNDETHKGIP